LVGSARALFGDDLISLALYGSAVGADFMLGRSDLNVVLVLRQLGLTELKKLRTLLPSWHKLGVSTPLLLDRESLERARDVFPMEFHDIRAQHRILHGENLFASMVIDSRNLRYQAEHEVRGKLLHLRALYAEAGTDRKRLEELLLVSVKAFAIIMRNLIRVQAMVAHSSYLDVLTQFEATFTVRFPTMHELLAIRLGQKAWPREIDDLVAPYLTEVQTLAGVVDRL
jgi:hypothetical protein